MIGERRDYAFPLRIDASSLQTAQTPYASHVAQMIEQVLLTAPGERADLPQFGCGLRRLVFAPVTDSLSATLKVQVLHALGQWLAGVIDVADVSVSSGADDGALEPGTVEVTVSYTLIDTQTSEQTTVRLL